MSQQDVDLETSTLTLTSQRPSSVEIQDGGTNAQGETESSRSSSVTPSPRAPDVTMETHALDPEAPMTDKPSNSLTEGEDNEGPEATPSDSGEGDSLATQELEHVFAAVDSSSTEESPETQADSGSQKTSPLIQNEPASLSVTEDTNSVSATEPSSIAVQDRDSTSNEDSEQTSQPDAMNSVIDQSVAANSSENAERQTTTSEESMAPAAPSQKRAAVVIDLVDSDDEESDKADANTSTDIIQESLRKQMNERKRQKVAPNPVATTEAALASYQARAAHMPAWMKQNSNHTAGNPIRPGASLGAAAAGATGARTPAVQQNGHRPSLAPLVPPPSLQQPSVPLDAPIYLKYPPGFTPSWKKLVPDLPKPPPQAQKRQRKAFQLSLLNVSEFTITGMPISWDGPPTSIAGLRAPIKSISRDHGKAVYERSEDGTGKWRIPLGAYHAFVAYLTSDPLTAVEGIPQHQLQIASLERARQERGFPSAEKLIEQGLPAGLANALAPFQRGGVDFVLNKGGRALIADDMGLGKTIQGVASMAVYHREWPLLVLCPSSARYHWENEFQHWLGKNSVVNKPEEVDHDTRVDSVNNDSSKDMLLEDSQIHVLGSSKEDIIPHKSTRVVICSYGLVPVLVGCGKLVPSMFACAIVDESHMLKNKATKRTSSLIPILTATSRCVLLTGTPAFARPAELWPQLLILGTERHGWWSDESEFMDRYSGTRGSRRAELHAMLTGTVMIRRLKGDIMKSMPRKLREKAELHVLTHEQRHKFKELMAKLREGKGALGKIAREEHAKRPSESETETAEANGIGQASAGLAPEDPNSGTAAHQQNLVAIEEAKAALNARIQHELQQRRSHIQHYLSQAASQLSMEEYNGMALQMEEKLLADLEIMQKEGMETISARFGNSASESAQGSEKKRTSLLSQLYALSGQAKIPLVVDMLKRWLNDPTKGKLCIFAHHINVLDSLGELANLSNAKGSSRKFIRIDGSTSPKLRQQQIKAFQTDPSIRIALLGITAAGVAVTLTASSTVWFAELFWTPAIMIQAEDRCHRIGQQARVRCLYFVAKGTIDDVLWRLVENKFTDLGEFVEGKEKMKLVIDKTFETISELHGMFDNTDPDESDNEPLSDGEFGDEDIFQLDPDLVHDIEALGEEERMMLRTSDSEDDLRQTQGADRGEADGGPAARLGQTEEDAIALSDDEEEVPKESSNQAAPAVAEPTEANATEEAATEVAEVMSPTDSIISSLQNFRLYKMYFSGPQKIGLELGEFSGRLVVSGSSPERKQRLGENSKPSVGDIVCCVNGMPLLQAGGFKKYLGIISQCLKKGLCEVVFAEEPTFRELYLQESENRKRLEEQKAQEAPQPAAPSKDSEVIEIDD